MRNKGILKSSENVEKMKKNSIAHVEFPADITAIYTENESSKISYSPDGIEI